MDEQSRAALCDQFCDITGSADRDHATALLTAHNWDLGQAINAAFEDDDNAAAIAAAAAGPDPGARQHTRPNGGEGLRHRGGAAEPVEHAAQETREENINKDDIPGEAQPTGILGYLLRLLMLPLDLINFIRHRVLGGILTYGWRFFATLLPGSTGITRPESGEMQRELMENFPGRHPQRAEGTLMEAANLAKRELKFFLIVLHNPLIPDSVRFVRETLCSEEFITFSDANLVLWAESTADKLGYGTSSALHAYAMPFVQFVTFMDGSMTKVWDHTGFIPAPVLLEKIAQLMEQYQPALVAEQTQRSQREMDRMLRQQQDQEYEASLRRDREKLQAAEAEKAKINREAREAMEAEQLRAKQIEEKKRSLPPIPADGEAQVKLKFKFPNGLTFDRSFSPDTALVRLYDFVDTRDGTEISADFSLFTQFPRKLLENNDTTLADNGMNGGRGVLNVQDNSV